MGYGLPCPGSRTLSTFCAKCRCRRFAATSVLYCSPSRLYQRAFRRRNTQHSRIYDEFGLAPTVSTTSAVYVWHDGTQARLLQVRELARLQGLPDNFVLPEGRVVATRLIGNAVPPALIRALLL